MIQESLKKKRKNCADDNSITNKSNKVPHSNANTFVNELKSDSLSNETHKATTSPLNDNESVTIHKDSFSMEDLHHNISDSSNILLHQENIHDTVNMVDSMPASHSSTLLKNSLSENTHHTTNQVNSDQSETTPTTLEANNVESKEEVCQWPWIRLMSKAGRPYYYNALTSTTSWFPSNSRDKEEKYQCKPPTVFSAANAQKTWQKFWQQCQDIQNPSKTNSNESEIKTTTNNAEDSSQPTINKSMAVYIEHYKSPTAAMLGRAARQQVRPPNTENSGYVQGNFYTCYNNLNKKKNSIT
jgi:hypothetical protein